MYENLSYNDLVKIIEEYKHRFAMIKDDVKAMNRCIDLSYDLFFCTQQSYGGHCPDDCLRNIEAACDLSSDECLTWTPYTNL